MTLPYIRRVVDTANALKSDVILLLGDYTAAYRFASDPVPYAAWAEELARLGAPLGQWAIFGNHDWWHDIASIRRALSPRAFRCSKTTRNFGNGGRRFWLAGLGDQLAYGSATVAFAAWTICRGRWRRWQLTTPCCYSLTSRTSFCACRRGWRLGFAVTRKRPNLFTVRLAGVRSLEIRRDLCVWHVNEDGRHLIVSGGLGTSVIPARLGVPPEIVHVVLGA